MPNITKAAACIALVASIAWFAGCRKEPAPAPPTPAQPAPPAKTEDKPAADMPAKTDTQTAGAVDPKIEAKLASLSAEDRALVLKQKICPVSGEPLGEMGAPVKVDVAGQQVFICCASCKEDLEKDPAKYLAKIGLKPIETPPLK